MKKIILFSMLMVCILLVGCSNDTRTPIETAGEIGEHEHAWGEPEIIEPADCVYDGEGEQVCSICGAREKVVIPKTGHNCPSYSYIENPTFLKDGRQQGACLNCGKNVREVAKAFKKEYKTVDANIPSVNNVYFNGYWTDSNGALTDMLGSEAVAKVTGASAVTYNFKLADASRSATVAYSTDGVNWTRQDLKENASLTVSVPEEETVVRVMYVGEETAEQAICLTSASADKGTVVPCVKDGATALTVSDKVDNIEGDTFTLAAENLGYTSWRISADGLGYGNFGDILDKYIGDSGKTTVSPKYILLDLGANDANVSGSDFTTDVSNIVEDLKTLYEGVDIYFIIPLNRIKSSQLETISTNHGIVSILDTAEWSDTDTKASSDKLSDFLVSVYGETMYFEGLYESYNDPTPPVFPGNKEEEDYFGALYPLN